jgi:hypothetical protein
LSLGAGAAAAIRFNRFVLDVTSNDPEILEAVVRRFAALPVPSENSEEHLRVDIRAVPATSILRPTDEAGRLVYESESGGAYWDEDDGRLEASAEAGTALCRPAAGYAEIAVDDSAPDLVWAASRPLFTVCLYELLRARGLYFLHTGAVEANGRCLLLAGASGVGKSTMTAALAGLGLPMLADDTVFVDASGADLLIQPFPDELDLSTSSIELLGLQERARTRMPGTEKWQLDPRELGFPVADRPSPPSVLIFPEFSRGEPALREIGVDEALLELTPMVLLTGEATVHGHLDALVRLAASVQSYRFALGSSLDRAAGTLFELASGHD